MNEDLKQEYEQLNIRIQKLLKKENSILTKINELKGKGISVLSKAEAKELRRLEEELEEITTSKSLVIEPQSELLDLYFEAKDYIDKLFESTLNKTQKNKTVNNLASLLIDIKSKDNDVNYTDDDARMLQIEINNKEEFDKYLSMFGTNIDGSIKYYLDSISKKLNALENNPKHLDKDSKSKIAIIIVSLLSIAVIAGVVTSCSKKNNKADAKTIEDEPEKVEELYESDELKPVDENNEQVAVVTPAESKEVEEPIVVKSEEAIEDKEADLVRRANDIAKTNFFEDVYASDIVKLLEVIDSKQLDSTEYANLKQITETTFSQIMINYFNDAITEDDVNKVNALRYYAKDNSDLDRFLETYATLLQDILRNPFDQNAKDKMVTYVAIFADCLNGFTDSCNILTDDDKFNENAIVNDYLNWAMVYDGIISPTTAFMIPRTVENIDGKLLENIMFLSDEDRETYIQNNNLSEYKDDILKYIYIIETINEAESKLVNHPQYCEIVGYNRSLGGED